MVAFLTHKQSFFRFIEQNAFVNRNHKLRNSSRIYFRTLLYLLYINDTPQAQLESHTQLYADYSSISCQLMDVVQKVNVLNNELTSICEGLADNNVTIHFVQDKTKCILSSTAKNLAELNQIYDKNGLKQFQIAEYLAANLSGESMAVNAKPI